MGRIPRYQRLGVRARQPQSIDYAGFRGQAQTSQAITRAFDQMSSFLYKGAEQQAVQTGLERVRAEGAQPILEELQAQGGPRGLQQRTAYEAANRVAVAEIRTEAELEITKILDQGQANKQSYSAIQAKLKDVSDGFPAALSNIDPVSAGLLRTQLQEATGKAELRYSKWWTGEIAKQRKIKQNNVAANTAESIIGNATVPGYEGAAIEADILKGEQTLADLGVKEELIEAWSNDVREKAFKEQILFDYNQKTSAEQGEFMDSVVSGKTKIPGMDYETSIRFVNGLLRPEYNRNVRAISAQSDFVVNKADELEDVLTSGGRLSQDVLASLRSQADEVAGQDGEAASRAVDALQETDLFFSQLRGSSFEEVSTFVSNLSQGIDGEGGAGRDTAKEVLRYEQAEKFLQDMTTQIGKSPMEYGYRVGVIQREEIFSVNADTGEITVADDALDRRIRDARRISGMYNTPKLKPLFPQEVRILTNAFEKATPKFKMEILSALGKFNNAAGEVLTQVADQDETMALMGALVNNGSTEAVLLAIDGKARMDQGIEPVGFTTANTFPIYNEVVGQSVTQSKHQGAVTNLAKLIYNEKIARKGITVRSTAGFSPADAFDADVYRESLQLALGQQTIGGRVFGGTQEVRGIQVFIPPQMEAAQFEEFMDSITAEKIERMTGQKIEPEMARTISGLDEDGGDQRRSVRNNYSVQHIGADKYKLVYHDGNLIRKQITDQNGLPIIVRIGPNTEPVKFAPSVIETPRQPRTGETITGQKRGDEFVEILEDEPPTGEMIESLRQAEAVEASDIDQASPKKLEQMGNKLYTEFKQRKEEELRTSVERLSGTDLTEEQKTFDVKKLQKRKDNQVEKAFQDRAFLTAPLMQRSGYQAYLFDVVTDNTVKNIKTFAEWKASQ